MYAYCLQNHHSGIILCLYIFDQIKGYLAFLECFSLSEVVKSCKQSEAQPLQVKKNNNLKQFFLFFFWKYGKSNLKVIVFFFHHHMLE